MPNKKKQIYRFLNNLRFTDAHIDQIKNYITNGVEPPEMDARQRATFIQRFHHQWEVQDHELVFTPLNVIAVAEELSGEVLLYEDPVNRLGKGINGFYDTVRTSFVGITRKMVEAFLKTQEEYQLSFHQPKKARKPMYVIFCNEKWGCDLVDMNQYIGYNH